MADSIDWTGGRGAAAPVGMPRGTGAGAIMLMPRPSTSWAGAGAMWVTAAGWAAAARRRFGDGWVVTPDAVATPEEALGYTRHGATATPRTGSVSRIPAVARTALKDTRRAVDAWRQRPDLGDGPWTGTKVELVWQHHDLFHRVGLQLARDKRCPLVSYVHAPQVWEAAKWGVARPGWGTLLERFGEAPQLRHSDVVACVSDEVAAELARFGVPEDRLVVAPMAVDPELFSPEVSSADVRRDLGLGDAFVVGWTGTFRKFHGLDVALHAFADLLAVAPDARLLLVGDGSERPHVEQLVDELGMGDRVVLTGSVTHTDVPALVAAMDVAVTTARVEEGFHYSPLKLREYMAAGRAVVAPRIGDVEAVVTDGESGLLYTPGDRTELGDALVRLSRDAILRDRLGDVARRSAVEVATWDVQLDRVVCSPSFKVHDDR